MRVYQSSILAVLLAFAGCGLVFWWFFGLPGPPPPNVSRRGAEPDAVKHDLCRLAQAETDYFLAASHYASEIELRSRESASLPTTGRWPYLYKVYAPVPNRFVIVATLYGNRENRPPAVVVYPDAQLQVCSLTFLPLQAARTLDSRPQNWGDNVTYDCDSCPSDW